MPTVHTIATRTHGRYLVDAPDEAGACPLLVGFHGYRENADAQLRQLIAIRGARRWIAVSIQALSRFYARGEEDIVGSWMTRQDRDLVIADNLAYVSAVLAEVRRLHEATATVVFAGFSQGSAMAYRAAAFAGASPAGLIVLAGDVPPDVKPVASTLPPTLLGRGTADLWYTEDHARADREVLANAGVRVIEHVFDDGHVWHPSFVARASVFLDEVSGEPQMPQMTQTS